MNPKKASPVLLHLGSSLVSTTAGSMDPSLVIDRLAHITFCSAKTVTVILFKFPILKMIFLFYIAYNHRIHLILKHFLEL